MSRSFKKVGGWTDHGRNRTRIEKRFASKKVRNTKEVSSGGSYKKLYCSYDICDYKFLYYSPREVIREFESRFNDEILYFSEIRESFIRHIMPFYKYYMK